jgi:hypothetical protein
MLKAGLLRRLGAGHSSEWAVCGVALPACDPGRRKRLHYLRRRLSARVFWQAKAAAPLCGIVFGPRVLAGDSACSTFGGDE